MSLVLVSINSTSPDRDYSNAGNILHEAGVEDECHMYGYTWIFNTPSAPSDIYQILLTRIVDQRDQFLVVPLAGPWIPFNCQSDDDCFQRSGMRQNR